LIAIQVGFARYGILPEEVKEGIFGPETYVCLEEAHQKHQFE
jgi:hypothetical protein